MTTRIVKPDVKPAYNKFTIDKRLRKRAEEQVGGIDTPACETGERALLHELQVHQVELEMQNEELLMAQAEVKAGLEEYQFLYDYAPVGYFSFDHDGSIRKTNLTGAGMLKTERSHLINRRFQLYLTNEARAAFTALLETVFLTKTRQSCEVALDPDGNQPVFVQIEAEASTEDGLCLAAVTDITALKLVEAEREATLLQEKVNLLLQSLLKPAPLETKLAGVTEAIVRFFHADFCRIWLIRPGDQCDQGCVHAEVAEGLHVCRQRDKCLHLLASSGRYTHIDGKVHRRVPFGCYKVGRVASGYEHRFLTNNVESDPCIHDHEWVHNLGLVSFAGYQLKVPGGETIGVLALFSKHTIPPSEDAILDGLSSTVALTVQQASAEDELHQALAYNRSLIEASLDPFVTISPDGMITDVNLATEKVTGYSREELLDKDFSDYFTEPERARAGYQKAFRDGSVRNYPLQIRHRDGRITSITYNAALIRNANGDIKGVFAVARDITELKTLETQLFQAQKMEAIGQLAGGIAHDFNNILTGIIGFSSLVEMHMDKDDPQRENINHVLVAADRASDLTKSLLAFSRKQIINPQPIDLNHILNKIEKFLKRIIGEDIALKVVTHQDVLSVYADSGQIEQVLMNLATNARDAMPHGGTLSIETTVVEMTADFIKAHGYGEQGEYALVSFSDDGMGMDEVTCKRLFEPFFTTKELGKGTGLGLSIVYGIVKQHNGFINVYSEPGVGTTFTLYLPLLRENAVLNVNPVEEELKGGTETILVVDDDVMVLSLAKKVLEQFGYTVITANDGLDAVEMFRGSRDRIALVILDVIMPNLNGKETFDEIRKVNPDIKTLFISGYTADIIHKRGMLDKSLESIEKPLRPLKLLQKVREVLDRTSPNLCDGEKSSCR